MPPKSNGSSRQPDTGPSNSVSFANPQSNKPQGFAWHGESKELDVDTLIQQKIVELQQSIPALVAAGKELIGEDAMADYF